MLFWKAIIYRIFRISIILVIALLATGSIRESLTISILDAIIATIYYYYFDKLWSHIEVKYKK
jgi:uncharacterized membrane protein